MHRETDYPSQFNYTTLFYVLGMLWVIVSFILLVIELAFVHFLNVWAFAIAWAIIGILFLGIILPVALIAQRRMADRTPRILSIYQEETLESFHHHHPPQQDTHPYASGATALFISGGLFLVITLIEVWHLSKNVATCCSATLQSLGANTLATTNALFTIWLVVMVIMFYTFIRAALANYYIVKTKKRE